MMRYLSILLLAPTVALAGGACSLIPPAAIQKAFGEAVGNAKPASEISGELKYSHCFYSLRTFTNSVSVSIAAPGPNDVHHEAAREFWNKRFHGESDEGEEHEAASKPSPLPNLGDEAYWVHSFVGNLYVLKGNQFLRISIGGKLTDEERQQRAIALAAAALKNLN